MALPFFFIEEIAPKEVFITLSEEASRHIVQVLRMNAGGLLQLTDGRGNMLTAAITEAHKKRCVVQVQERKYKVQQTKKIAIAISVTKNASRFEWFLEKATEMGIGSIIPLICERTEKQHFRLGRMRHILISAMLQSQQVWLPELQEARVFKEVVTSADHSQKWIAHCLETEKKSLAGAINKTEEPAIVLIGPEGDFTKEEIDFSIEQGFIPVTLGKTRLRTETAGMVAAVLLTL